MESKELGEGGEMKLWELEDDRVYTKETFGEKYLGKDWKRQCASYQHSLVASMDFELVKQKSIVEVQTWALVDSNTLIVQMYGQEEKAINERKRYHPDTVIVKLTGTYEVEK